MLSLFFIPYGSLFTVTQPWLFISLWVVMGIGVAGIGVNIMHDANHGSFAKNKFVNNSVRLIMNMLGGDATIWRLQHNVLHHAFTNIHEADEDIIGPPMLRFSPHDRMRKVHRFQFVYAWLLYCLMTLIKVAYTDYKRALRYRKIGLIRTRKEFGNRLLKISIGKLLYLTYILVLPLLFAPSAPYMIVLGFLVMHFVSGVLMSIIFQTAHVMPTTEFPVPDGDGKIDDNWAVHQMRTTTNFSPKSKVFSWFIGGLNYQVEHHLFANISHIHYRQLSEIVAATAREFGIPYLCQPSFAKALQGHGKMLYILGR
jgi:linoleoyl-CoA desaturase